jgi:hypothetical protein
LDSQYGLAINREESMAIALEPIPFSHGIAEICLGGWGHHTPSLTSEVLHLGARSIELDVDNSDETTDINLGAKLWVSLTLPTGQPIRPLVEVTAHNDGRIRGRITHVFPDQREYLVAYDRLRADSAAY